MSERGDELINGRYRLISVIGQGAMGTVWRGHDEVLDREVAIKKIILSADLDEQEHAELKALAKQEARATAALNHPGIITVFDVIEHDQAPVIVMELIEGRSLAEILKEQGLLRWRRVGEIGAAMADALAAAHAAGIVHRDLKPANVLVAGRRIVITDFGIAQRAGERTAAAPGEASGTPAFMSPEQAENAAASPAADLWSLGATLFNAAEGVPLFQGPNYASVLLLLLTQPPPTPRRAGPLTPLITSLLRKDPQRRPTAEQVTEQLATILRAAPAPPAPPVPVPATSAGTAGNAGAATGTPSPSPVTPATPSMPLKRPARSSGHRRRILVGLAAVCLAAPFVYVSADHGLFGADKPDRPASARPPGVQNPDTHLIGSLAFSPKEHMLAVGETVPMGSGDVVELFNVADHARKSQITLRKGSLRTLAFSPDAGKLATGEDDGGVEVWDVTTRKRTAATMVNRPGGTEDEVHALRFSRDGKTLFTCDGNGRYGKWAIGDGKPAITPIPGTGVQCLALSPSGTTLTAYTATTGELTLWTNMDGHPKATVLAAPWPSKTAAVSSTVFSPDGTTLAVTRYDAGSPVKESGPGVVELWDVASRTRLATHDITLYKGGGLAISPDSKTLAATAADGDITVWKLGEYQASRTIPGPFEGGADTLAFSPDSASLAAAGNDALIRVWDLKTERLTATWQAGKAQ